MTGQDTPHIPDKGTVSNMSDDEAVLDPELPIVDAHQHLWDQAIWDQGAHPRYLWPDLLADMSSGHDVRATIYVECSSMYNLDAQGADACVGEVEFANGIAAMSASGLYGTVRACAGIVGNVDLRLGDAARPVLEAMAARAPTRFKGIRNMSAWDPHPGVTSLPHPPPEGLLASPAFRAGFAHLAPLGLTFDAWAYSPQLEQVVELADAFPQTPIVIDHFGGRVGVGPYAGRQAEVWAHWSRLIGELALRPNVSLKLGGIGTRLSGSGLVGRNPSPTSEELAAAWQSSLDVCLEAFGSARLMFESNFPVDKRCCSYRVLWNTFKRLTQSLSVEERNDLLSGTAIKFYRLPSTLGMPRERLG